MYEGKDEFLVDRLVNESFAICKEREITLSQHAVTFLRLAADAWIKDAPRSTREPFSDEDHGPNSEFWIATARVILEEALADDRLVSELKMRGMVSFTTLVRALANSGHRYMLSIGFKS